MEITVLDSMEKLIQFEKDWRKISNSVEISLFSTFDYIRLVWKNFSTASDKLMIIVIMNNTEPIGIVPLRLSFEKEHGIPMRVIRYISEWQGDRPDIITNIDKNVIWQEVCNYLHNSFVSWDKAVFVEQDRNFPIIENRLLSNNKYYVDLKDDSLSYFISLDDTWDNYFKRLKQKVRSNYKNRLKKIENLPGGFTIEQFRDEQSLRSGLDRFVSIEQSGWKKDANIGVGKNAKHKNFYGELLAHFILHNQACIYILRCSGADMAGLVLLKYDGVIFESQITFNPDYSKYSPAIVLRAEVLKLLFNTSDRTYDMMGMYQKKPKHKSDWAAYERQTFRIEIYKKGIRLFPFFLAKYIKKVFPNLWNLIKVAYHTLIPNS